jgi:uncharacterized OsmC-like protein
MDGENMKRQKIESRTTIEWIDDLKFKAKFDLPNVDELIMDEPVEIGGAGKGPNAERLISAAVGDCLCASLLFCLKKSGIAVKGMNAIVDATVERNDEDLLRLRKVDVKIQPIVNEYKDINRIKRCQNIFEKYCIVTASLKKGIEINVDVVPKVEE